MSREMTRKGYYTRERVERDRGRNWERAPYRSYDKHSMDRKRSRSPIMRDIEKRRSRSPRKNEKDLDENILSEISKLPDPSELWDSQSQFPDTSSFAPPHPPNFQQENTSNPSYGSNYQPSYAGIYDDFPSVNMPAAPVPPDISSWNQMSLPPPPVPTVFVNNVEDQIKKEAAIESEMRQQKAALSKQREDYIKKAAILKKELETLKDQRNELRGDSKRSPSPDTKRFLKENTKLQLEIQNKLKTINNVVDMLNGIIGEEAHDVPDFGETTEKGAKRKSRSPSNRKVNYVYYDPEMHWCRVCTEFPPTAKDYLNHLHSAAHHKMAAAHMEAPWHTVNGVNEGFHNYPSAPTKRTPIRGLQFFVPSTAWYCKLCDQFIGDLHCASAHLKSIVHAKNYINFVEQNPHWETDWMSDRQKAFEKSHGGIKPKPEQKPPPYAAHTITFNKDGFHTKRKNSPPPAPEDKKKKKDKKRKTKRKKSSSSSSSSNSSSSDSEPVKKKKSKSKKEKKNFTPDNKTLTQWMSSIQVDRLNDSDRKLLDTLKSRESERRDIRNRERREEVERERRREDRRRSEDSRVEQRRSPSRTESKKPEIKKMPFIGKMPVYKNLNKGSKNVGEQKKEEGQKKKDDDEASKKRRVEMDAEIQKKVAEFKEKIAKAQLERQLELGLPAVAMPVTAVGAAGAVTIAAVAAGSGPPVYRAPPQSAAQQPTNLPKDFQDALDIIFPSDVKPDRQQDLFCQPPGMQGFPVAPLGMPGFPPMGMMQQQMPPPMMMGFDMNAPLFNPRAQLYDSHVPLVASPKNRQNNNKNRQNTKPNGKNKNNIGNISPGNSDAKKKEELDDLALLGIDASDVGAGI